MKQYTDSKDKYFQIGKFKVSHLKKQSKQVQNFVDYFKKQVNKKIHTKMSPIFNGTIFTHNQYQMHDLPYSSQQLLNNSHFQIYLYPWKEFQKQRKHKNQTQQTTLLVGQFMEYPITIKMPFQTFSQQIVHFLGSVQQWQVQILEISASYQSNNIYQKPKNIIETLSRNLSQIKFQNLKRLTLVNLQIKNIQFLSFMNLSKVNLLFLQNNLIRSLKPLNKIKRNTTQSQVRIGLLNNLVAQFALDRIKFAELEMIQLFINILSNNSNSQPQFYYKTNLNFLVKSCSWEALYLKQYCPIQQKFQIKSNKKLNKILYQLIKTSQI